MLWTVTNVIDGDTFDVIPNWEWKDQTGNSIRAAGYNTPEKGQLGYQEAKDRLTRLIQGKDVELGDGIKITYGRLLCPVFYNGKNLAEYFPEYKD